MPKPSLPPPACKVPRNLDWQLNASTGHYIANVDKSTRLLRSGRPGRYLYRAEYWGDYSRDFPIGSNALTPRKALADLCSDVRKLRRRRKPKQ